MEAKKRCPYCAEEILAAAIKCKHCYSALSVEPELKPEPQRNATGTVTTGTANATRFLGIIVVAALLMYWLKHLSTESQAIPAEIPEKPKFVAPEVAQPIIPTGPTQAQFCSLVLRSRKLYKEAEESGANEVALSELRHDRQQAFAALMTSRHVDEWTGELYRLTTSSDGSATLIVHLSCAKKSRSADNTVASAEDMGDDHVSLWNSRGLPRGTEPYSSLVDLRDGAKIQFSGDFVVDGLNSRHDYLRINDLTESGSMTDPTFVFWYTEVTPVSTRAVSGE